MDFANSPKVTVGVHCLRLRTKSMYVNTVVDLEHSSFYDPVDSAAYWCSTTQGAFGPDGQPVRPDICQGDRGCCKL